MEMETLPVAATSGIGGGEKVANSEERALPGLPAPGAFPGAPAIACHAWPPTPLLASLVA